MCFDQLEGIVSYIFTFQHETADKILYAGLIHTKTKANTKAYKNTISIEDMKKSLLWEVQGCIRAYGYKLAFLVA